MTKIVYDHSGNKIQLICTDKCGGEGKLYKIQGNNFQCAKIFYPDKIKKELYEKILTMVENPLSDILLEYDNRRSFAWPNSVLYGVPLQKILKFE